MDDARTSSVDLAERDHVLGDGTPRPRCHESPLEDVLNHRLLAEHNCELESRKLLDLEPVIRAADVHHEVVHDMVVAGGDRRSSAESGAGIGAGIGMPLRARLEIGLSPRLVDLLGVTQKLLEQVLHAEDCEVGDGCPAKVLHRGICEERANSVALEQRAHQLVACPGIDSARSVHGTRVVRFYLTVLQRLVVRRFGGITSLGTIVVGQLDVFLILPLARRD
eukprot:scaffold13792_cov60-Phaeocystis_antarctica.AAC.3